MRIELTKYGFANRPVSHSGTAPRMDSLKVGVARRVCQLALRVADSQKPLNSALIESPENFMELVLEADWELVF